MKTFSFVFGTIATTIVGLLAVASISASIFGAIFFSALYGYLLVSATKTYNVKEC